jgi:hypothetical protein
LADLIAVKRVLKGKNIEFVIIRAAILVLGWKKQIR